MVFLETQLVAIFHATRQHVDYYQMCILTYMRSQNYSFIGLEICSLQLSNTILSILFEQCSDAKYSQVPERLTIFNIFFLLILELNCCFIKININHFHF